MILKDFIDEVCNEVGAFDSDLRQILLRNKISFIEDMILNFTDLISKTFNYTVGSDLTVKLPYDFNFPIVIKRNGNDIYRKDANKVANTEDSFSIDVVRVVPFANRRLVLRPDYFEYINIPVQRSDEKYGYGFQLITDDDSVIIGETFDNENIFYPENNGNVDQAQIKLRSLDSTADPTKYQDVIRYSDDDEIEILTVFGLYKIKLKQGVQEYYLAENGFTYDDAIMTNLISRGVLDGNNRVITFNEIAEGDEIYVEYNAQTQKYINENQVDIVLDTFKNLIFKGCVWQAYIYMQKPQKAREIQAEFVEDLKLAQQQAGKIKTFGKRKLFRAEEDAFRLRSQRVNSKFNRSWF